MARLRVAKRSIALASNLFFQIPVSVARMFVTSDAEFAATEPYPLEKISPDFTILGLPVNQILPLSDTVKTEGLRNYGSFPASGARQFSEPQIWDNLKQAIAASSGFNAGS